MTELTELEIRKKIAAIEGITLTYSDNIGEWSSGAPYGKDDLEYNPLTNKTLLWDLVVKYKVSIDYDLSNTKYITTSVISGLYEFESSNRDAAMAVLLVIIEANSNS